jgi:hypothetical protein
VAPRGDQFVYTKVGGGPGAPVVQTWLSVDGTRNRLGITTSPGGQAQSTVILGCAGGSRQIRFAPGSCAYLGLTTWGEHGQEGGDALIQTAITDRPGQLP